MAHPFDNGQSFGDPFVSKPSESSEVPHTPPRRRPRSQPIVPTVTPPNFGRVLHRNGILIGNGIPNSQSGPYQYPNQMPLPPNRHSRPAAHHGPPRTPPRPIPPHVEDARPPRTIVPLHHPLRMEIVRIRNRRIRDEALFQQVCKANPRQSQDMNWNPRATHEKEMKEICLREFELLESIERLQEGERYDEVNLDDAMLSKCLQFDRREKSKLSANPDNAQRPMTHGLGSGHTVLPSRPGHSMYHNVSYNTAIPSMERDSNNENRKIAHQTGAKATQPSHATAAMPPWRQELPSMPLRPAFGSMAPHGPSMAPHGPSMAPHGPSMAPHGPSMAPHPAANQRSSVLPPAPVLHQGMDASRHHAQKPQRTSTREKATQTSHATAEMPPRRQELHSMPLGPAFGSVAPNPAANQRSFVVTPARVLHHGTEASHHHTQTVDCTPGGGHTRIIRSDDQQSSGATSPELPSTPKVGLAARALAAKRRREASATPLEKHDHHKRQKLAAEHQHVGDHRPGALEKLATNLERLGAEGQHIGDDHPGALEKLTARLEKLDAKDQHIGDDRPGASETLAAKLEKLVAEHQHVGGNRPGALELEKFRNDSAIKSKEVPEHAVLSGEEGPKNQDNKGGHVKAD